MSNEEKDRLVGQLVREHTETWENLRFMEERARRVSQAFAGIAAYMSHMADSTRNFTVNVPQRPEPDALLDFGQALELADKISSCQSKLDDLQRRKASLGIG